MSDEITEWSEMWGARVKMPVDMRDDVLRFAIEVSKQALIDFPDFETEGLQIAEVLKNSLDDHFSPSWHAVVGKSFGTYVTHETFDFCFFYLDDKAFLIYKAG